MTRKTHNQRSFSPIGTGGVFTIQDLCNHLSCSEQWGRELLKSGLKFRPHGNIKFSTEEMLKKWIESGAVSWEDLEDGRKGPSESG